MAVTPAFELTLENPDATRKQASGSRHANIWTDLQDLIVDSFMKSSIAELRHIPSLEKITNGFDRVELGCGKRVA
jgi:hypothetical protein